MFPANPRQHSHRQSGSKSARKSKPPTRPQTPSKNNFSLPIFLLTQKGFVEVLPRRGSIVQTERNAPQEESIASVHETANPSAVEPVFSRSPMLHLLPLPEDSPPPRHPPYFLLFTV